MRLARVWLSITAVVLFCSAAPAGAFNPTEESSYWEIPRLGAPSQLVWENVRLEDTKSPGLEAFSAARGGVWRYQINHATGTFHHLYGSGIDLGQPLTSGEQVESVARGFVGDHAAVFAVGNEDLQVMKITHALGKWSIIFAQAFGGVEVWGGRAHLVFTDSGRLFAMGSDVYPGIQISTTPTLSEDEAVAVAKSSIGFQHGVDTVEYSKLFILPVERSEGDLEYRLAWRFDLRVANPLGLWATWVDANTGEILWRENHFRFTDFTGHSQGDVEWDGYCDGYTLDFPLRNMRISISGVGVTYTDADGDFVLAYGGTDPRTISAEFRSPWVNVNRYSGTDASHTGTITPGVFYTIDWSSANSLDSERDCYSYVNKEHDWLKAIDPAYTGVDYEMACWVERTDGYCPGNAWWDGSSVNLCAQSASYGNTGRMGDVLFHEYGHAVTDFLYGAYDPPGDMHEGNSDIIANYLTRESIMGLGFYLNNCTTGIRDADNTIQYPCSGEIHYCGQLISGFHWDAWQELQAAYPQAYADSVAFNTWHYGRKLGLPQNQPDQVYWTFVADDDDGNLDNGTPHYEQFCTAATNHSFTCPEITVGVFITHTPLENTMNTTTPYAVVAEISSTEGAIDPASCRVTYRVDGGSFANVSMTATGNPDEYVGYIPAQASCSEVEYYIYGADVLANEGTDPRNAPADLHAFLVGYEVTFWDDFEGNKGWTVGAAGDDATTGVWERCDPQATLAQPEDDHTAAPGVNAYITQCAAGSSQGSYDVDNGKTTLLSPVFDVSGYTVAAVRYFRWYSNDTGDNPGEDYWVVEVTDDGWATWATLENTNVSQRAWTEKQFNLGSYIDLTSQVQLRFVASDELNGSLVEAGVDDFELLVCTESADTEAPVVTVVDPNGGEQLAGGGAAPYTVRWTATDNVGVTSTTLLLSTDGGTSYPTTIASGPAVTSPYSWNVPDIDASAARIKVVCQDAALNEGEDESDGDFGILSSATDVTGSASMPAELVLRQNQPNPFNPVTEIEFGLPSAERIALEIYNVQGRLIKTLAEGVYAGGYHKAVWRGTDEDGAEVSTGVYFYRLVTDETVLTRKMLMVK